jgi:hypothetical protein
MDTRSYVDSEWLKAKINVNNGDHIRIEDEGTDDGESEKPRLILKVTVIADGKDVHTKKFSPNKTNMEVIQRLKGFDSKKWIGAEFRVNIEKVRNPQTNLKVDGIVLSAPNVDSDGNVIVG